MYTHVCLCGYINIYISVRLLISNGRLHHRPSLAGEIPLCLPKPNGHLFRSLFYFFKSVDVYKRMQMTYYIYILVYVFICMGSLFFGAKHSRGKPGLTLKNSGPFPFLRFVLRCLVAW